MIPGLIAAGSALATYLGNRGQANREKKVAQEDYTQQANNNALNNSNVVYNQQQANTKNAYNALQDAPNYREQESRRSRQDALLQALIGKNPGLGNLKGIVASPEDRQRQYFEARQKGAAMEGMYVPKSLWEERWNGMTQDFGGTDEQSGAQRSSIMASGLGALNDSQGAYDKWLETQNKYSTANQQSIMNQSGALESGGLEKLGTILGLLSGTYGAYRAGEKAEDSNTMFEKYLQQLLASAKVG